MVLELLWVLSHIQKLHIWHQYHQLAPPTPRRFSHWTLLFQWELNVCFYFPIPSVCQEILSSGFMEPVHLQVKLSHTHTLTARHTQCWLDGEAPVSYMHWRYWTSDSQFLILISFTGAVLWPCCQDYSLSNLITPQKQMESLCFLNSKYYHPVSCS